jgi:hypothetical protein
VIIETTSNIFYEVIETGSPDLAHVWLGVQVRFDKKTQSWVRRPNRKGSTNRPQLVSKAHCYRVHVAAQ